MTYENGNITVLDILTYLVIIFVWTLSALQSVAFSSSADISKQNFSFTQNQETNQSASPYSTLSPIIRLSPFIINVKRTILLHKKIIVNHFMFTRKKNPQL